MKKKHKKSSITKDAIGLLAGQYSVNAVSAATGYSLPSFNPAMNIAGVGLVAKSYKNLLKEL